MRAHYHKVADLPARIPLFPLRGAILLPRATLPLNIFEPRYLTMIDDALSGDRIVGIVQPEVSGDDEASPLHAGPLRHVGCAGRITSYQELDDGRQMISLTGTCRFTITREVTHDQPYRVFDVDYARFARDLVAGAGEEDVDRRQLLSMLKSFLESHRLDADWKAIAAAPTEVLINSLSIVSPYGPEEKQALLEAIDLARRAEVLIALTEMELAGGDSGGPETLQ